jgi:hypothetical protein
MPTPEKQARKAIDDLLNAMEWRVQNHAHLNPSAARGMAVREFPLQTGHGGYLRFVGRKFIGVGLPTSQDDLQVGDRFGPDGRSAIRWLLGVILSILSEESHEELVV